GVVRRGLAVLRHAQDLPSQGVAVLRALDLVDVPRGRVEVAVGAEGEPSSVVVTSLGDAVDDDLTLGELLAVELEAQDPVVLARREVDEDEAVLREVRGHRDPEQPALGARDDGALDLLRPGTTDARDLA